MGANLDLLASHTTVRLEDTRGGKFAKLVANHIFRDVYGGEDFTVVNAERVSDEVGRNRRAAGPSLDWFLSAGLDRLLDFFEEVVVDKETFFDGTCHGAKRGGLLLVAGFTTVMVKDNRLVRQLATTSSREALRKLTPRRYELLATTTTL